jgi:hypothetical protein
MVLGCLVADIVLRIGTEGTKAGGGPRQAGYLAVGVFVGLMWYRRTKQYKIPNTE